MAVFVLEKDCSRQITEAELRKPLATSSDDESGPILAWTSGMNEWRPLAEVIAALPEPVSADDRHKQRSLQIWPAVILTAMILWVAAISSGTFALWDYLPANVSRPGGVLLHIGAITLGAVLAVIGTIYFWRRPARRAGMPMAGVLFLAALVTTLFAIGSFIANATYIPDLYSVFVAQAEVENATVFRGSDGTIYIMGSIGPHLLEDFLKAEEEGPVKKVEITSGGGLVYAALELATYIEAKEFSVFIRAYCHSACIQIAVASPESYADRNATFGFHRYAPLIPPETDATADGEAQETDEAILFLKSHGVPDTVLAIAHKHAGESIYEVTADEMVTYGAIKGTVSGTKVIRTGSKH